MAGTHDAERQRLLALADYSALNLEDNQGFSAAVGIVAHFLDVPMCALGLIEEGRIRFVSSVGVDVEELPRGWALTPTVLAEGRVMTVPDTTRERLFAQHPLGPGIGPVRAWAAAPLRTLSGQVIAALFAADRKPRPFTENQVAVLEAMGDLLMTDLEVRRQRHSNGSTNVLNGVERHFESLLRDASDTVAVLDADGALVYSSPALCKLLGYDSNPLLTGARLVHRDDLPLLVGSVTLAVARPGLTGPIDFRMAHDDGSWRSFEAVFSNNLDDPSVAGLVVYLRDVTERHRTTALLAGEARVLELIARDAPMDEVLLAVVDLMEGQLAGACAVVREFDEQRRTLTIVSAPNLPATLTSVICDWPVDARTTPFAAAARTRKPVVFEDVADAVELDQTYRAAVLAHRLTSSWAVPVQSPVTRRLLGTAGVYLADRRKPDAEDEHVLHVAAGLVALAIERNAAVSAEAPREELVARAELIRRLDGSLARSIERGGKVAVMLLDLDRFNEVNEGLGHEGGDLVLPMITQRVADVVRPNDLVARVAGDEFVVVCEGLVGELEAVGVAERIHAAIKEPVRVERSELRLTASIGIAMTHGAGDHAEALLRDADAALYQAKQRGRARFELFNESRRREARDRRQLETELDWAIEDSQLRVWFQPEIELATGELIGFEALVRWQHPERGLLPPAEFVPQAERSGLIDRLGTWVLDEACQFGRRWRDSQPEVAAGEAPMVVSVNLSACQLSDPALPDRVAAALTASGLAPDELCLELTESALMDDADRALEALLRLKALGVRLAIDDFGTGYSSLAYLRRFPIDAVKIDRSFVTGLGTRTADCAIVTAVLGLTRALGLTAIAEGVEETGQRDELVRLGCAAAQGYLFSPPRPEADLILLT